MPALCPSRQAILADADQGEVFAESLEGVGSRFILRLPVS
jgi:signal transduction histidine kinase